MDCKFIIRTKAFLPSIILPFFFFLLSFVQIRAATTTFATDSSWRVTSTNFANWNTLSFVPNASWVAPGGGNVNCGVVQTGVVGAPKIWYPATNSLRTCYFRKSFPISQLCEVKSVTIDIAAADTYVLFVNGIAIASGNATAKKVNIPIQVLQCENVIAVLARDTDAKCWWMAAKVTINTTPFAFTAASNSSSSTPVCAGQTLNLSSTGLAGATYAWTGPNGFTSNQQNPTVTNVAMLDTGVYTVVVKIGKCCRYVANTSVNIKNCKECLDIFAKEIVCKNGVYTATICIKNNSSNVATNINLISSTSGVIYSPNTFAPPGGLLPGQTYCKNVTISGAGSGASICLRAMLFQIKDCKQTWFCGSQEDFCVQLPECIKPCAWAAVVKDSILTICKGTSVMLAASTSPSVAGASYVWSSTPASTIVNGNTATPTVTPLANPTVYTVTITTVNPDGTLCNKKANVTVYLKDCPPLTPCDSVKVGFMPNSVTICLGDSVQLNPNINPLTGLTYLWIPATGLSSATIKNPWAKPSVTTTYNLIVSVPGTTCKKDGSITVVVKPCPPPVPCQWALSVKDSVRTICKGSSTTLAAQVTPAISGANYSWTSSTTGFTASTAVAIVTPMSSPITYYITVSVLNTDGTVCIKKDSVKVTLRDCTPPCLISVAVKDSVIKICRGSQATLSASSNVSGAVYNWTPTTSIVSGATSPTAVVSPLTTTTYTVTATDTSKANCRATTTVRVEVSDCGTMPSSSRMASDNEPSDEITISPNPTQSVISIQIPDSFNWESATLINSKGVILNELERTDNAKSVKFDVQSQPSGMYIISVKTDKGFVNKKVMKE